MLKINLCLTYFVLALACAFAQKEDRWSQPYYKGTKASFLHHSFEPENATTTKSSNPSHLKSLVFAHTIPVTYDVNKTGEWQYLNGTHVWRLGLCSKGAYSLSLLFSQFTLLPGDKLFIYTPDGKQLIGALTHANNKPHEQLAIRPLAGDSLIIELQTQQYPYTGKLEVGSLYHDYKDILGTQIEPGSCNIDVRCVNNVLPRFRNSVVKLVIGDTYCTGTLVNTTNNSKKGYVLTAKHCYKIGTSDNTVFIFNHEHKGCNGSTPTDSYSISGASFLADGPDLDFQLMELSAPVPLSIQPYYAGWDASGNISDSNACIHHPQGSVKKISFDFDETASSTYNDGVDKYRNLAHWKISEWEMGTTEGGSSGSPLINKQDKIIGMLTGGIASCSTPNGYDQFQKFSKAYDFYSSPNSQLKTWLDPDNTGQLICDAYDPVKVNSDTLQATFDSKEDVITLNSPQWGYTTGHSSESYTEFAQKFTIASEYYVFGFQLNPGIIHASNGNARIRVSLLEGLSDKKLTSITLDLNTLNKGWSENIYFESPFIVADEFYIGYEILYDNNDTFALRHYYDSTLTNTNMAFIHDGSEWQSFTDIFGYNASLGIQALASKNNLIPVTLVKNDDTTPLLVYPNPTQGNVTIELPENASLKEVQVYNTLGQLTASYEETNFNMSLEPGVYFVVVLSKAGKKYYQRLIVE